MSYLILSLSIALGFPIYHLLFLKKIDKKIISSAQDRLFTYKLSSFVLWILLFSVLITVLLNKDSLANIGIPLIINKNFLILSLLAIGTAFYLLYSVKINDENAMKIKSQIGDMILLLPNNIKEFKWYTFLSFSAGVCEEIVYRGFLYFVALKYMSVIPAVLTINLIFAMAHLWSNTRNILAGFFVGIIASVIYILSGSIWISAFLHFVVDFQAGLVGYKLKKYLSSQNKFSAEEE